MVVFSIAGGVLKAHVKLSIDLYRTSGILKAYVKLTIGLDRGNQVVMFSKLM